MLMNKIIFNVYSKTFCQTVIILLLVSCKVVGPDYKGSPEVEIPDNWNNQLNSESVEDTNNQKQWWRLLDDPVLNNLISKAAVGNLDAKIALSRVEEARAN